jgi:putative sugar O-methyltransferase
MLESSGPQEHMIAELRGDDPIFLPSGFWADLNSKNQRMLDIEGLANFKRTVAQNYFNWLIQDEAHPYFRHVRENGPSWVLEQFTTLRETDHLQLTTGDGPKILNLAERDAYRRYVCHVWSIMQKLDRHRLRKLVTEPNVGNPFPVKLGPKLISQDLATSIIECNLLADLRGNTPRPRVAELGAGYGRLAYVFAKTQPGTYYVFDIPPALAVAQWYAERTIGKDQVFKFRHIDDASKALSESENFKIAFFTPNQLRKFPSGFFDIVLSISTLPEMRRDQAYMYLSEFQRLSHSYIFLKQWRDWANPIDGSRITPKDYVLPSPWKLKIDQQDPIIPDFVNMVWSRN